MLCSTINKRWQTRKRASNKTFKEKAWQKVNAKLITRRRACALLALKNPQLWGFWQVFTFLIRHEFSVVQTSKFLSLWLRQDSNQYDQLKIIFSGYWFILVNIYVIPHCFLVTLPLHVFSLTAVKNNAYHSPPQAHLILNGILFAVLCHNGF